MCLEASPVVAAARTRNHARDGAGTRGGYPFRDLARDAKYGNVDGRVEVRQQVRHAEVGSAPPDVVRICDEPHSRTADPISVCSTVIEGQQRALLSGRDRRDGEPKLQRQGHTRTTRQLGRRISIQGDFNPSPIVIERSIGRRNHSRTSSSTISCRTTISTSSWTSFWKPRTRRGVGLRIPERRSSPSKKR